MVLLLLAFGMVLLLLLSTYESIYECMIEWSGGYFTSNEE